MEVSNGSLYFGTKLDNTGLKQGAEEAKRTLHGIGTTATAEGQQIDNALKKVGQTMVGIFAASKVKDFAVQVAKVRGEFQQLEIALKTMTGSVERADALMAQLKETAVATPFQLSELAQGAKQLLAYGVQAEELNETLIRLGDIAAGLSIPIGDLAYLYGTTMVQGRMYTMDLNQFLNRGIPLVDELAKQFGVTKDEVKGLVTEGKVGFENVKQAVIDLTSEGSKFGGLMAAQSKSITGQWSAIEDQIELMFDELGKKSEGVISGALTLTGEVIENWETIGKVLLTVIASYGTYKAAVLAVAAAHKIAAIMGQVQAFLSLTKSVTSAKDAMLLLNMATKANPWVLIASAVAAAATAMFLFSDSAGSAADMQGLVTDATKEYNKSVIEEQTKIDALFDKLTKAKEGTAEYKDAKQAILDQYGKYLQGLGNEVKSLRDVEGAYKAVSKAAKEAAKSRAMESFMGNAASSYAETEANQRENLYQYFKNFYKGDLNKTKAAYQKGIAAMEGGKIDGAWLSQFDKLETSYYGASTGAVQATVTNRVSTILKEVQRAKHNYDEAIAEAERRFGALEVGKGGTASAATNTGGAASTTAGKGSKGDTRDYAEEAAKRNQAIAEYGESVKAQTAKTELEIRQAQIANMEEGFAKQQAQIQLNYDRLIAENVQREQQMKEALADAMALEWENKNPKAKDSESTAYRNSVLETLTRADLTKEQQAQLAEFEKIAAETKVKANKEALNTLLHDALSYEQQRAEIAEEYARKRENLYQHDKAGNRIKGADGSDLFIEGASQANVEELNYQEGQSLSAIDEQFAQREATYQAWCNSIADLTLQQLQELLAKAQEELKNAENNGGSSQSLAIARAKVTKTQNEIKKQSTKTDTGVNKRSIKEWEDLYKTLNECNKSFEDIGDTIGGVAGDIIKTAGQISSSALSMINGIVQLTQSAAQGVQTAAQTSSKAIQAVEKASVIVTIISAALQIAMKIASLFNNDESKQKEIDALQGRIDQLQWELDNADIVRLQQNKIDTAKIVTQALNEERAAMLAQIGTLNSLERVWAKKNLTATKNSHLLVSAAEKIATAYANVAYTADKALGDAKYADARSQLENIAKQQVLISEQMRLEKEKKKSDDSKYAEYERQREELTAEAISLINDIVEEIMGGSAEDIAQQLSDAFFEAFQEGEDYAQAWHDEVNSLIADIMKKMLVQQYLEKPIGEIFDEYKKKWFKDGTFLGAETVRTTLSGLTADLNEVGETWQQIWETLPEEVKKMVDITDDAREAAEGGIATASQDTVDELNGRATAIQGHTYSINENTKLLVNTSNLILQSVMNIERETDGFGARMERMESNLKGVKDTVDDIALKGIKIK